MPLGAQRAIIILEIPSTESLPLQLRTAQNLFRPEQRDDPAWAWVESCHYPTVRTRPTRAIPFEDVGLMPWRIESPTLEGGVRYLGRYLMVAAAYLRHQLTI